MDQLRSTLLKLQQQLQEQSQAVPSFTAKQEEEKRRAEKRAAQEIHQLTQVCVSTGMSPKWNCPVSNLESMQFSLHVACFSLHVICLSFAVFLFPVGDGSFESGEGLFGKGKR